MTRRDPTILVALVAALGAHLLILGFGVHAARRDLGWWLKSQPVKTGHPMEPVVEPKPMDPLQQLGDHDTNGTSANASPGQRPMESADQFAMQEQAAMQRDPAGFGGKGSNEQLEKTLIGENGDNRPRGSNSNAQSSASVFGSRESSVADMAPKVNTPTPVHIKPDNGATGNDTAVDPLSRGPMPVGLPKQNAVKTQTDPNPVTGTQSEPQQTGAANNGKQQATQGGIGGKPGAPDSGAGNPLPTSDFESYPVTHVATHYVEGKIVPQNGRKSVIRQQPRFGEAADAAFAGLINPVVVLQLRIDTSGNVTDVQLEHSSGSDDIDFPCVRAAYTWWFEPLKDAKTGQVRPETMEFTIYF